MTKNEIMKLGVDRARRTMNSDIGGPFGAVVVKGDEVISIASNTVLKDHDPTCHAEMNAIREACKVLGTHDLSGCELFASGSPCPMCLSAIMWANIKKVYISGEVEDAEKIGFRDDFIYRFIKNDCKDEEVLSIERLDRKPALSLYDEYANKSKEMY